VSLRRDERGFVLITAMIVLSVFMVLTVAIVTIVDVQTTQTGHERSGEAAFNLAQSALLAEADQLQVNWPATAAQALPTTCNQSTTLETGCEGTALTQEMQTPTPGPDYTHATWSAQVLDNTGAGYSPSMVGTAPAWDFNGDNTMWVRAQATANGQTRTVIEQVTRRLQTISLPENVVTAGGIKTNSNGTPTIIEAQDPASGIVGPVDVRCDTAASTPPQTNCIDWAKPTQLDPQNAYQAGYVDPTGGSALSPAQITAFTQEARADHTLYNIGATPDAGAISGCPPDGWPTVPAGQTYPVVVVEGANPTPCPIKTDWVAQGPGVLLYLQGSVSLGAPGNPNFNGVLYMANENPGAMPPSGSACTAAQTSTAPSLVSIAGSGTLTGAIFVDGCGLVNIQDNGDALNFSLNALRSLQTYGTATPAPGTFRVVSS
jgi:Tfp pilus assembly protein PilX